MSTRLTHRTAPRRALCWLGLVAVALLVTGSVQASALAPDDIVVDSQLLRIDNLTAEQLKQMAELPTDDLQRTLAVYVANATRANTPPVLGNVQLRNNSLVFIPRFPWERGQAYRLVLSLQPIAQGLKWEHRFSLATKIEAPKTRVLQVYPSSDTLPQNLFKFYLQFSHSMRRGEAHDHVHLLDERGHTVALPFLDIGEELWNPASTRLTLLFDPGRTKRGLKPNRDLGLPLAAGKRFTLVIDRGWKDADGIELKEEFHKTFHVTSADHAQPDPQSWTVSSPKAGSREALNIVFDEPLDYALLHSTLAVETATGNVLAGGSKVSNNETRWRFVPAQPWRNENHHLVIKSLLEDRAANSVGRAFEVFVTGERGPEIKPEFRLPIKMQ